MFPPFSWNKVLLPITFYNLFRGWHFWEASWKVKHAFKQVVLCKATYQVNLHTLQRLHQLCEWNVVFRQTTDCRGSCTCIRSGFTELNTEGDGWYVYYPPTKCPVLLAQKRTDHLTPKVTKAECCTKSHSYCCQKKKRSQWDEIAMMQYVIATFPFLTFV